MKIKENIPNAITCANLLCGCLAIVAVMNGNLKLGAYLVGTAAIFDFLDGFVARMLHVSSSIGKDLDSLADMVTFGVVPGIMLLKLSYMMEAHLIELNQGTPHDHLLYFICFSVPIFSAIRLAKFNNDDKQSDSFIGLPTPANAIFVASLGLLFTEGFFDKVPSINTPNLFWILSIILSVLLVSKLNLIALKFKHFNWKGNEIRYLFLALSLLLILLYNVLGITLAIFLYLAMSFFSNVTVKR